MTIHKKKQNAKYANIREDIRVYRASDKHRVGQKIYHPVFKDVGVIVKRDMSPSGNIKKIIVEFEEVGEKNLLTEHTPK